MPLVFVTDAPTASGIMYDDVLGFQYEFPMRYQGLVKRGETFVYYKGSRGVDDGRPRYFGVGMVGDVRSGRREGHLLAQVSNVQFFERSVPAKLADGTYIETSSTRRTNWQNGVRRISDGVLARIIDLAEVPVGPLTDRTGRKAFASAEHARRLERYSVAVTMKLLGDEFGETNVTEMPPGNPGYDIVVARPVGDLHVEVKGTVLQDPVFHLSEGQRKHAEVCGTNFRLVVIYRVDLTRETFDVVVLEGPLDASKVQLKPEAWTGRVRM